MSHDYHQGQPNYNQFQLYYDGCEECKKRSTDPSLVFSYLKDFRAAWHRAVRFQTDSMSPEELPISETEAPVLRMLVSLAVEFERYSVPFGQFPGDTTRILRQLADETKVAKTVATIDSLVKESNET